MFNSKQYYSKHSRLEPDSLLLGTTSKRDNKDAIGSFGEGYKIALLVLTRSGYKTTIYNHQSIWTPEFRMNKKFGAQLLCITTNTNSEHNQGVTFKIEGLNEEDIESIKESCLFMQKDIGQVKNTSKGLILMDKPHMLYIGGLFICKTSLDHGYDIKPEFLTLERDRQTVATFDLKWLIKDMWFEIDDYEYVVKLMEKDCPDLEHADYGTPEILKEACYKHFKNKHGDDAIIASSQTELEDLVKKGMTNTVVISSGSYSKSIRSSSHYSSRRIATEQKLSVAYYLEQWLIENKKHMRRHAIVNFKQLIQKSMNWKFK